MSDYIKKEQDLLAIVSKHAKDWKSLENVPAKALLRIMRDAIAYSEAAKATGTAGEQEPEAHKLARILWNMVEAVEDYQPNEIYREGYSSIDGDVFVHRAGNLLVEQAAEISELTRYVDAFGSKLAEAARQPAPAAEIEPCGGCGNTDPDKRCIGCSHQFGQVAPECTFSEDEIYDIERCLRTGVTMGYTEKKGAEKALAIFKAATNRSQP